MVGTSLGHYRIERLLGSSGMSDVYLAEDRKLGRQIALKRSRGRRWLRLSLPAGFRSIACPISESRWVGPAAWLPDGMSILVNAQEHSGETSTQILACRASVISPGRKRLAIVRGRVTSDVVLVSTLAEAEEWAEA